MNLYYPNSLIKFRFSLRCLVRLTRSTKFLDRQCVWRSLKVSGGMLKTYYESNARLLLKTDLRWLLWRLGLLGRALKSGLWLMMRRRSGVWESDLILKKYFLLTQPLLVLFFELELLARCYRAQLKKIKTIIRFTFVVEKIMYHSLSWLREIFCQLHQMAFSF